MSTLADFLPHVIDLTRQLSPDVIDLTGDTPSPPGSPLQARSVTPLVEVKPETDILVPATQHQALLSDDDEDIAPEREFDEDAILTHPSPPSQRFPSRQATIDYLNDWAITHGFALVIGNSSIPSRWAYLACICHPQLHRRERLQGHHNRPLEPLPGAAFYERQPGPEKRKAKRTLKTDCGFKMYIKDRSLQDSGERGRGYLEGGPESWSFEICEGFEHHNHPPLPPIAVAFVRRLNTEQKAWVVKEVKKGTAAMDIVRGYRSQWPGRPIQPRDVWNLAYSVRKTERAGFSASEATLAKMRELGELHDAWTNDHGQLVGLAYTSSKARALTHRFPTGLFFDCTYKTNLYKLPLLHIVGSTASGQTFTAAVVMILRETTAWYEKAISSAFKILGQPPVEIAFVDREPALHNALLKLKPRITLIFCLWHIKENIKDRYAKDFAAQFDSEPAGGVGESDDDENDFSNSEDSEDDGINDSNPRALWRKKLGRFIYEWERCVVVSKTLETLRDGVTQMRERWGRYKGLKKALDYVCTDLLLQKEHFVHAFTDKSQHFGQRSSSSIEGRHYKLKRNIKRSRADVFYLFEVIRRYLDDEWDRINARSEEERSILARDLGVIYSNLNGRVSRKCLSLIQEQMSKYRQEERARAFAAKEGIPFIPVRCLGATRHAYGLPCFHDLAVYVDGAYGIPLDKVHRQWHLTSTAKMEELRQRLDNQYQAEGIAAGEYERLEAGTWEDAVPRVSNPPQKRSNQAQHQRKKARWGGGKGKGLERGGGTQADSHASGSQVAALPATDPNTGRILSQGERVDGARVRARTCGHCGRTGHDLRRCPEGADERARRAAAKEARRESQALNAGSSSQYYSCTQDM